MKTLKRTWADVSLDNLANNFRVLRAHVSKNARILGVMKADGYGHGAVPVSHALAELGAGYLAVSNLEEAVQLRRGGVRLPILILGYTPASYADTMVFMDITQEVHSLSYAQELDSALAGTNYILNVHLKLDTGMTRIGFFSYGEGAALDELVAAATLPHLHVEGAFTHFCAADSTAPEDAAFTKMQYDRFCQMREALAASGVKPEICHCANSGATLLYPEYAMDMVRPGIALYGHAPSADTEGILPLRPMMSLHTTIAQLREVPAGASVSYGRTYQTEAPLKMAVLPIGYADGLSRALSGRVSFRLRGKMVSGIGRICMDMCMVDVTAVPEAAVGDELTLFGYDADGTLCPCETLAQQLGTISYEVLCSVNKRIPRIYLENGKPAEILQYIV